MKELQLSLRYLRVRQVCVLFEQFNQIFFLRPQRTQDRVMGLVVGRANRDDRYFLVKIPTMNHSPLNRALHFSKYFCKIVSRIVINSSWWTGIRWTAAQKSLMSSTTDMALYGVSYQSHHQNAGKYSKHRLIRGGHGFHPKRVRS